MSDLLIATIDSDHSFVEALMNVQSTLKCGKLRRARFWFWNRMEQNRVFGRT